MYFAAPSAEEYKILVEIGEDVRNSLTKSIHVATLSEVYEMST